MNSDLSVIKNVSQSGVTLELYREISSDLVLLSFVTIDWRQIEIKGKVVSSGKIESGATGLEISFQASRVENIEFAKNLVMFHRRCGQQSETIIDKKSKSECLS